MVKKGGKPTKMAGLFCGQFVWPMMLKKRLKLEFRKLKEELRLEENICLSTALLSVGQGGG